MARRYTRVTHDKRNKSMPFMSIQNYHQETKRNDVPDQTIHVNSAFHAGRQKLTKEVGGDKQFESVWLHIPLKRQQFGHQVSDKNRKIRQCQAKTALHIRKTIEPESKRHII